MKEQREELWDHPPISLSTTPADRSRSPELLLRRVRRLPFRPAKGQRGGDHFSACCRNSGPRTLFEGLLLCFLSCARPPDIRHLFSVKFSCKVSRRVVPEHQHVKRSGCSQTELSSAVHVLVSQDGSGRLGGEAHPLTEGRRETEHRQGSENPTYALPLMTAVSGSTLLPWA